MGETFLKLAASYCKSLDSAVHKDIFEPIQLAVGTASGAEIAMQRTQAKIESDPSGYITLHLDCINAFNSVDRAAMLALVYADKRLRNAWNIFAFAYGKPSSLLIRHQGHIMGSINSAQGVKQGCVLGSLGFALVMQPVYEACLRDLPAVSASAIMDDFTITGPPEDIFEVYDRFVRLATPLGVLVNTAKTKIQQARGVPSALTIQQAAARSLEIVKGNHKCLGGLVGVDDAHAIAWLEIKLTKQTPLTMAIADSRFPSLLALRCAKINNIPKPMYLLRAMPLRITLTPITSFDQRNRQALLPRLIRSPSPLPPSALISLTQPGRIGLGLLELESIAPAARWASAVAAAKDLQTLVATSPAPDALPFVQDRVMACYMMRQRSIPQLQPGAPDPDEPLDKLEILPHDPNDIIAHYDDLPLKGLQRALSKQIVNRKLHAFLHSADCSHADKLRLTSCQHKTTSRWMRPHPAFPLYSDLCTSLAVRMRLGLPPLENLPTLCSLCDQDISLYPWHGLSCKKVKRRAITVRHDRATNLLLRFARSQDCAASFFTKDLSHILPDGHIAMTHRSILFDFSGVNIHAPSYADMEPGAALDTRAAAKRTKNEAFCRSQGCDFVPVIVDQYGCMHADALQLLADIQTESLSALGTPNPLRLSKSAFLQQFSSMWHFDNARIMVQWLTMSRDARVRRDVSRVIY